MKGKLFVICMVVGLTGWSIGCGEGIDENSAIDGFEQQSSALAQNSKCKNEGLGEC